MRDVIAGTGNRKKLQELERVLGQAGWRVCSPSSLGLAVEVSEDGETFAANAARKAIAFSEAAGMPALADDSGLEVDALGGAPGVRSSRYAGETADDAANVSLLLRELETVPEAGRAARFRCVVALAEPAAPSGEGVPVDVDGVPARGDVVVLSSGGLWRVRTCDGEFEGAIARTPRGTGGFGYDPVFLTSDGRTLAEWVAAEKDAVSHRGRALAGLLALLGGGVG